MAGAVFAIGFLDQLDLAHKSIVDKSQNFPRGVYIVSLLESFPGQLKNEFSILFARLSDFKIKNDSNEQAIASAAIADSIRVYDLSYQYCLMVEIEKQIIGGGFIPFHDYREFGSVIKEAIAGYNI